MTKIGTLDPQEFNDLLALLGVRCLPELQEQLSEIALKMQASMQIELNRRMKLIVEDIEGKLDDIIDRRVRTVLANLGLLNMEPPTPPAHIDR